MKLAIIPPRRWSSLLAGRDYNLVLPEQLEYEPFGEALKELEGFKILDNGVAEGTLTSRQKLMELARTHMVNEVVLPDCLYNMAQTVKLTREFLDWVYESTPYDPRSAHEFMGVAQGSSYEEVHECIRQMRSLDIDVFGIPRHLCTTIGKDARYRIISEWRHNPGLSGKHIQFHLLGTNPAYIYELSHYGKAFRTMGVRGVDTSAPFTYALAGLRIDKGDNVSRPENYLTLPPEFLTRTQVALIKRNTEIIEGWLAR